MDEKSESIIHALSIRWYNILSAIKYGLQHIYVQRVVWAMPI